MLTDTVFSKPSSKHCNNNTHITYRNELPISTENGLRYSDVINWLINADLPVPVWPSTYIWYAGWCDVVASNAFESNGESDICWCCVADICDDALQLPESERCGLSEPKHTDIPHRWLYCLPDCRLSFFRRNESPRLTTAPFASILNWRTRV